MWLGLVILDFIPGIEIDYILLLSIWAGLAELVPMVGALLGALGYATGTVLAYIVGIVLRAMAGQG